MICNFCWKKIAPFTLTFLVGSLVVIGLEKSVFVDKSEEQIKPFNKSISSSGHGIGSGHSKPHSEKESTAIARSDKNSLNIISKPGAFYTDAARQNDTQGIVVLRVAFLASGEIGNISTVSGLPDGLTEQAIAAAKQIKFQPAAVEGKAVSVTKQVQYSFSIY
jgi:TonB family protein